MYTVTHYTQLFIQNYNTKHPKKSITLSATFLHFTTLFHVLQLIFSGRMGFFTQPSNFLLFLFYFCLNIIDFLLLYDIISLL